MLLFLSDYCVVKDLNLFIYITKYVVPRKYIFDIFQKFLRQLPGITICIVIVSAIFRLQGVLRGCLVDFMVIITPIHFIISRNMFSLLHA